jgi:hypothetical protein
MLAIQRNGLLPFSNFVADHRASSRSTDRAQRAAKNSIASHAPEHGARARSDLRIGRAGAAPTQGHQTSESSRNQEFCIHCRHLKK